MRCRACATSVDEPDGVPLCPACAAVTGSPREPARSASTSALWLWTSPHAAAALATGDLGVMIRTWRQATGTSQLALAEKLGYDPSYISMIETGRRDVVDIVNRRRIAQHLGIPLHRVGVTDTEAVDHVTMLQHGTPGQRKAVIENHVAEIKIQGSKLTPVYKIPIEHLDQDNDGPVDESTGPSFRTMVRVVEPRGLEPLTRERYSYPAEPDPSALRPPCDWSSPLDVSHC